MTAFKQFQELTISMWINLNSEGDYDSVRSPNVFKHGYRNDGNGIYCEVQDSAGTTFTVRSGSALNTGNWYHSTLYYNQSELRVYINGDLKATTTTNGNALFNGDKGFFIGEMDGILDEVRFYERALTESEIQTLYEQGLLNSDTPPGANGGGVAYYKLDEDPANTSTVTDSFGSNEGDIKSSISQADPAIRGTGMNFDGTNGSRIELGNVLDSPGSEFTASLWVKPASYTSENGTIRLISKYAGTNSAAGSIAITIASPDLKYRISDSSNTFSGISVSDLLPLNEWRMLTYVFDNGTMILYRNGVELERTQFTENSIPSLNETWSLGEDKNVNIKEFYEGDMDDVRIYDRVLTESEIHEIYRFGTRGKDLRKDIVSQR